MLGGNDDAVARHRPLRSGFDPILDGCNADREFCSNVSATRSRKGLRDGLVLRGGGGGCGSDCGAAGRSQSTDARCTNLYRCNNGRDCARDSRLVLANPIDEFFDVFLEELADLLEEVANIITDVLEEITNHVSNVLVPRLINRSEDPPLRHGVFAAEGVHRFHDALLAHLVDPEGPREAERHGVPIRVIRVDSPIERQVGHTKSCADGLCLRVLKVSREVARGDAQHLQSKGPALRVLFLSKTRPQKRSTVAGGARGYEIRGDVHAISGWPAVAVLISVVAVERRELTQGIDRF